MWEEYREKLALNGSVFFYVKASPNKSRTAVQGKMSDGAIKIALRAPADKGKANAELCRYLANAFRVPEAHVKILSGKRVHRKRFKITL